MTGKAFAMTLVATLGAFAQREEPKIVVNLDGFRYPPIAKQARIFGDVAFRVGPRGRELVSSANPLLTAAAESNLQTWTLPPLATGSYLITYHFVPLETGPPKQQSVPIGSGLSRFFRRLVGAPTTKTVEIFCYSARDPDPAPSYAIKTGDDKRIDITTGVLPICAGY